MDWRELLQQFGFPTVMVMILLIGISRVAVWLANHAIKPLIALHVDTLEAVKSQLIFDRNMLNAQAELMKAVAEEAGIRGEALRMIQLELRDRRFCQYPGPVRPNDPPSKPA